MSYNLSSTPVHYIYIVKMTSPILNDLQPKFSSARWGFFKQLRVLTAESPEERHVLS